MIPHRFHPDADAELAEAALFYESRMPGLGKSLAAEVERTIALLCDFPDAGTPVFADVRRAVVARYPYSIVYRHRAASIEILALAHQRRRPGYWHRRT